MGRKLPTTPRSHVKNALRILFLWSRERRAALSRTGYCCSRCGVHASKAKDNVVKVQVHHKAGVGNWEKVIDSIYEQLLCDPSMMEPLCVDCHAKETEKHHAGAIKGLVGDGNAHADGSAVADTVRRDVGPSGVCG